ncbi:botryococcene synthase [Folsomia candida]|uniref:botryococcene synthase n=1 Tax=Folsomia candida TaxID=158441 RepID=UPI000B8FDC4A|nr:botryococcene synthase [Folsomia candida]XP_035708376.1 botryococcene synthase [Folsomia candida]
MAPKVGVKEVSIHNFAFMPFRLLSFVTLVKFFFKRYKRPGLDQNPAMEWCYETLVMQSKPYSYIIAQLPENLKDVFVVCYLWARTADTIEDDYNIPESKRFEDLTEKYPLLLRDNELGGFTSDVEYGMNPAEKYLMKNTTKLQAAFSTLSAAYRSLIRTTMSNFASLAGRFLALPTPEKVATFADLEAYSWAVAGLFEHLYIECLIESGTMDRDEIFERLAAVGYDYDLARLTQFCRVIRDIAEDVLLPIPRLYWPTDLVTKYCESHAALLNPQNVTAATKCLNEMIFYTLNHVEKAITCLKVLSTALPASFRASSTNFLRDFASLVVQYNNPDTFKYQIKIGYLEMANIVKHNENFKDTAILAKEFAHIILQKVGKDDPNAEELIKKLYHIIYLCEV